MKNAPEDRGFGGRHEVSRFLSDTTFDYTARLAQVKKDTQNRPQLRALLQQVSTRDRPRRG
jgi:hypothetical protein